MITCTYIYIYTYSYMYIVYIYTIWNSPQWVPMTTTGSPGVWMDHTPGSPRALHGSLLDPLTATPRKVEKTILWNYTVMDYLAILKLLACWGMLLLITGVAFLSLSWGVPYWFSLRHPKKPPAYRYAAKLATHQNRWHKGYQPTRERERDERVGPARESIQGWPCICWAPFDH